MLATTDSTTEIEKNLHVLQSVGKPSKSPWRKPSEAELNRARRNFDHLEQTHNNLMLAADRGDLLTVHTYLMIYGQEVSRTLQALGAVEHGE